MDPASRIETALTTAMRRAESGTAPPLLAAAMRHAVFPRGARVRPRLCLAVAASCGANDLEAAVAAGAAIEFLHAASLVHDDLPCFDDAPLRRGRPSVHVAFGEALAVLAGDALIVLGFQTLALGCAAAPALLGRLCALVAQSVGMPGGIVAGQAWESESEIDLARYHRAKTGALFAAATMAGALAAGATPEPWRALGEGLGEAYQAADDLGDAAGSAAESGKLPGRDAARARPNAAATLGIGGALAALDRIAEAAVASIPDCPGRESLAGLIRQEAHRLVPAGLAHHAA